MMKQFKVTQKRKKNKNQPQQRIYLDYAAATPVDSRVSRVVIRAQRLLGNPSSLHKEGVFLRGMINDARATVAACITAHPDEIVFTSGGTESNNLAIAGVIRACVSAGKKISFLHAVTSVIEHSSVLDVFRALERDGLSVTYLSVNEQGGVDVRELKKALRPETVLVSIMHGNNEISTLQPLRAIAKEIRAFRAIHKTIYPLFHTDACQTIPHIETRTPALGVDLLSASASKFYGPKGVGFLYVRRGISLVPLFYGGSHEGGRRAGTENAPGIIGCAEAFSISTREQAKETKRLGVLRGAFLAAVSRVYAPVIINGEGETLPHIVNISLPPFDSEEIVLRLDAEGFTVSGKSACKEGDEAISYVVRALGSGHAPESAVRISFGRGTTRTHITSFLRALVRVLAIMKKT